MDRNIGFGQTNTNKVGVLLLVGLKQNQQIHNKDKIGLSFSSSSNRGNLYTTENNGFLHLKYLQYIYEVLIYTLTLVGPALSFLKFTTNASVLLGESVLSPLELELAVLQRM